MLVSRSEEFTVILDVSAIVSLLCSPVVLPNWEWPWGCGYPRTHWNSACSGRGLSLKIEMLHVFLPQLCSCCPHSHQINVWDKLLFLALLCWEQGHFYLYMLLSCGRPNGRWLIRSSGEAKDWDLLSHLHLVFHVELPSRRRKQAVDPVVTGSRSQGERWMTLRWPSGRQKSWRTSSIILKSLNSWIHSAEGVPPA